jgi:hypothetical protein
VDYNEFKKESNRINGLVEEVRQTTMDVHDKVGHHTKELERLS